MTNVLIWFAPVLVFLISSTKGNSMIVEDATHASLQCNFLNTVKSITWKSLEEQGAVNISTCSTENNTCNDTNHSIYQGFIVRSGNESVFGLNVIGANETGFACFADNGEIVIVYDPPIVSHEKGSCPYGDGMHDTVFLMNGTAYCECALEYEGVPRFYAQWYNRNGSAVGEKDTVIGYAWINTTYDYTDPDQSFECRAVGQLDIEVAPFTFTPRFTDDYRVLELGKSVKLECSFPANVTSITWQRVRENDVINMSTCIVGGNCTNPTPAFYNWTISSSGNKTTVHLNILHARQNETAFLCVADNGLKTNISQLDLYTRPTKPQCSQQYRELEMVFSCTVDNIYPKLRTILHRRNEVDFRIDEYYPWTTYNSTEPLTVRSVNLTYEVFLSHANPQMTVYVEVIPALSDGTLLKDFALSSEDIVTNLSAPVVALNTTNCPIGPGVSGNKIKTGTTATCRCDVKSVGFPPGRARWYSEKGDPLYVGEDADGSATLSVIYDAYDKDKSYECRSVSRLGLNQTRVPFQPIFYSSAPPMAMTALQALVILFGVVVSGIIPRFD